MKNEFYYSEKHLKTTVLITIVLTSLFWLVVLGSPAPEPMPETVEASVATRPLYFHSNTPPSNRAGWSLRDLDEDEYGQMLSEAGFRNVDGLGLPMMRRLFLAWHYKALYEKVAKRTGISEPVLFAYFIIEATSQGVESKLWMEHWNPGGIKYRGRAGVTFHKDDCGGVPCAFESVDGFDRAVEIWSSVFNNPRYKDCKRENIDMTCACLKKSGYYTGPGWKNRAAIARQYESFLQNNFPLN